RSTIPKSVRIGNPADGCQVVRPVRDTGGTGVASTDEEILKAIDLLAETEGIFTEPAGGATLAGAVSLIRRGVIPKNESVVVCITGNGYKTAAEVLGGRIAKPVEIGRSLADFQTDLGETGGAAAAAPTA